MINEWQKRHTTSDHNCSIFPSFYEMDKCLKPIRRINWLAVFPGSCNPMLVINNKLFCSRQSLWNCKISFPGANIKGVKTQFVQLRFALLRMIARSSDLSTNSTNHARRTSERRRLSTFPKALTEFDPRGETLFQVKLKTRCRTWNEDYS